MKLDYTIQPKVVMTANVPCNGCVECCKGDAIFIHEELGDVVSDYQTEVHPIIKRPMLAHKPNGDCIYLGEQGCAIHGHAPAICREFDCRDFMKRLGYTQTRVMLKKGLISQAKVNKGKQMAKLYPIREA